MINPVAIRSGKRSGEPCIFAVCDKVVEFLSERNQKPAEVVSEHKVMLLRRRAEEAKKRRDEEAKAAQAERERKREENKRLQEIEAACDRQKTSFPPL